MHFTLCGGTIAKLGTRTQHDKYFAKLGSRELPGCFGMTELVRDCPWFTQIAAAELKAVHSAVMILLVLFQQPAQDNLRFCWPVDVPSAAKFQAQIHLESIKYWSVAGGKSALLRLLCWWHRVMDRT